MMVVKMLAVLLSIADIVLVLVVTTMSRQLMRANATFTPPVSTSKTANDTDIPSVTVCIPARNEQHALTDCLHRVLDSDYGKLEIIVLDDASGDNTSALIKSFASEGVRFVEGSSLPDGWLGKNHALQGLLNEASGSYILFMDVDTALSPSAISNMVREAMSNHAAMLSVMPRREDGWRASVIASPLRYFWEIMLHSRVRAAVSSSAWLIRRDVLQTRLGGFEPLKNTAQPEGKLALELSRTNEYRFLMSTEAFGVAYEKKWRSQLTTATRLYYPLLGKQSALSILAALDVCMLLIPFVALALLPFVSLPPILVGLTAAVALSFCIVYGVYTRRMWRRGWWVGAIVWPLLLVQEAVLILISAIRHTRGSLQWRGRSIQPEA